MNPPLFTLSQAADWLPGARVVGEPDTPILRVHTDTRSLQAGDLFVALRGERFDANDLLPQALSAGAAAVLAHVGCIPEGAAGLEVDDTRRALGQLAAAWRARFQGPLVAITGSNGKTTVTQMVASILRAWRQDAALSTLGNLNNDIGVPQTLLRLRDLHRVAVVELGMNHPGEIAQLADIARPTVALVNNAQREHQEFMATVEAVARENGAVFAALPTDGVAVFPASDPYSALWSALAGGRRCMTFGEAVSTADVGLIACTWRGQAWSAHVRTPAGALSFSLRVAGRHNVINALAAAACALAAGAPLEAVAQGLVAFEPVAGRSRSLSVRQGDRAITVVDDTYNANPDSVRAAIDVLAALPGPHLLVLGDMGEVGDQGPQFHAEVGAYARERGIAVLLTLGEQSRAMGGTHCETYEALEAAVLSQLPAAASVLVKGSRFMKMERVVQAITAQAGRAPGPVQEQPSTQGNA
jgi:UDP-N-acetylmuramoyl-tripeptide--D-alanyl-D-alanine ligase